MAYAIPASLISRQVFQSQYVNQIISDLNALGLHDHSGSLGEGNSTLLAGSAASNISSCNLFRYDQSPGPTNLTANDKWLIVSSCTYSHLAVATNGPIYSRAACDMIGGVQWGFQASGASVLVAGEAVVTRHYVQTGTYKIEFYYRSQPTGGVLTISDVATGCVLAEVDTYAAASAIAKASASFANAASPYVDTKWAISTSKNSSATTCAISLGVYTFRWVSV